MSDEQRDKGMLVELDLGRIFVGDDWETTVEDLIVKAAASMLLNQVDEKVRSRVDGEVESVRNGVIREQVEPIIREAIQKSVQPTDAFGQAKGEPTTLAELIQKSAEAWLQEEVGEFRSRRKRIDAVIAEEVDRAFKAELKKAVEEAKVEALKAVREAAGEVIAETVRRAGASL